jgi:vitamin K-dependent gamma-carboxylase
VGTQVLEADEKSPAQGEGSDNGPFSALLAPVDAASLAVFRIGFGLIAAWWAIDYVVRGRMQVAYLVPKFHFTYYGFDWIQPWPESGMYLHFLTLALSGIAIAVGFYYRAASILFAIGLTYVFLLDRTNYQNHYYLLVLISWLMTLLPLSRMMSADAVLGITTRIATVPRWMLWLTRFHIGLPYFFGGVAKFEADWFAGAPLRQTLHAHDWWPIIGPLFHVESVVQTFIWGGLLFDVCVVPLLIWKPTRVAAYGLCIVFHLMNSQLFDIHIFPWFMMIATTVFFEPDWPRRFFNLRKLSATSGAAAVAHDSLQWSDLSRRKKWAAVLLSGYCLFHCVWPLRHHVYPGPASWTEQGHYFSWRMMLRGKNVGFRYFVTDPFTGRTQLIDPRPILSHLQMVSFGRDPEMILHLAHHIADEHRRQFGSEVEVRALILTSLNGRKPQLQIDPNVNLAAIPRGFHSRPWIMPLTEPLPETPWTVPISEWEQHVQIPTLTFLKRSSHSETTQSDSELSTSSQ